MIARMTPSSRPQLVLDVKAFNTKTIGSSESLFYPDTAFVESEEWAQEWAGRIFECVFCPSFSSPRRID